MIATQPAFESTQFALHYGWETTRIETDRNALAETIGRTRIELPMRDRKVSWSSIAEQLRVYSQALCVVNTTKDARELFRLIAPDNRFHLSARLCPAHRHEKLTAIRARLAAKDPCQLVSTQLIEAVVDVDFPIAYRALGPLDSIIQTAGRCNREGRSSEPRPVIVFRPEDGGTPPGAYRLATAKTEEFLNRYPDCTGPISMPNTSPNSTR